MAISRQAAYWRAVLFSGGLASLTPVAAQSSLRDCSRAWGSSLAANSCEHILSNQVPVPLVQISVGGGQWAMSVHCSLVRGPAPQVKASFTGSMDEVKRLHHCNGELKLDGY